MSCLSGRLAALFALVCLFLAACAPRLSLLGGGDGLPLSEVVLEGEAREKILLLPLTGMITDRPSQGMLRTSPSPLEEVVARLDKAALDPDVRAVVLKVDSPGGTVVASDILTDELERFGQRTGKHLVAAMMGVAASGGYMACLPAERIVAHPSSITGSVGTIMILPNVSGLMGKLGITAEVAKSGRHKDMGSPLRAPDPDDQALFQAIIEDMNARFLERVRSRRGLSDEVLAQVATARVYTAAQALDLGLVDAVGNLRAAVDQARELAALPGDARVVVYRRTEYGDDTVYNIRSGAPNGDVWAGLGDGLGIGRAMPHGAGFYHLWSPGAP